MNDGDKEDWELFFKNGLETIAGQRYEIGRLEAKIRELEADNESLREGRCRWNCATAKEAFMAGFDAGAEDAADSGVIICDDFKKEVTEKAYKEWRE